MAAAGPGVAAARAFTLFTCCCQEAEQASTVFLTVVAPALCLQVQPGEYYITVMNTHYGTAPLDFTLYYEFATLCPPSLTFESGGAVRWVALSCPST